MADICTLIIATTMTLQMCYSPRVCGPEHDGKIFCSGPSSRMCPSPPPAYECKREDGTTYIWTDEGPH